jgi:ABC-type antimicrobial peptide transport system permease subunit
MNVEEGSKVKKGDVLAVLEHNELKALLGSRRAMLQRNFNSFAEMTVVFRFGPTVVTVALLMTLAMGVFGGLFPALRAVRLDVIRALREL